jgi:signal transduction histidine kinase/ActR/RegA family two-component response regulator/PAS domain-containing protein
MFETRVDSDLRNYHHVLENKAKIEKSDVQYLLDGYREKFDLDMVFVAEMTLENHMVELICESCRDGKTHEAEKIYYGAAFGNDDYIRFDDDGLCEYGYPPYDADGENSILHYGIFHNGEYMGSAGFLKHRKGYKWDEEERCAVQKLGRVLMNIMTLNHAEKQHTADVATIGQQGHALEAFFATMECGIIWHTIDGKKILRVNDTALQLLDYDSKEDLEKNFQMIAPSVVDDDKEMVRATIRRLKKPGDAGNVGYYVKHRNGDMLYIMGRIRLLEDNGNFVYQRVIMDCTEHRLREKKELRENESYWLEIISALSQDYSSTFFLDTDTGKGRVCRATKSIRKIMENVSEVGFNYDKMMKLYIDEYVYPEDRIEFRLETSLEMMKKRLTETAHYYVDYRVKAADVEYYQAKIVRVGRWENQHGVMIGFRSVDEKVKTELEYKKNMEETLKKAEQASRAKSSFLSSMSHDIRTPMNAIIGYTTLAKKHYDEQEKLLDYLDKITISSNHLLSLINDVLEMSRIESGKISIENSACSLIEIMEDLKTVMIGQIQEKKLNFYMNTDNIRNDVVMCDRLRLNQILLNVLGNAVKFTPEGGNITVDLSQKFKCPKEGYAGYWFRIKDTGIGMSEEFQKHLFEQFSRENNTTVSGIPGTGLGMAITKSIVDMMEGKITVRSRLREGTEFIIDINFPLVGDTPHNDGGETEENTGDTSGGGKQEKSSGRRKSYVAKRLLLAEDNQLNQEIATEILTEYGFNIEVANNGREALEMVKNSKPGYYYAVLMDVQMPVMNGYEATWRIRALEDKDLSNIPIITMTANAFEEDKKMAIMAGMNDFVAKPLDVKKLLEALDRVGDSATMVSAG